MTEHKEIKRFTVKYDTYNLEMNINESNEVSHFIVIGDMSKHSLIVLLAIAEGQIALAGLLFKEGYTCAFENIAALEA